MKHPCENCLILAICVKCCDDINDYIRGLKRPNPLKISVREWFKEHEIRPRVLDGFNSRVRKI
jgi:hypothetical protein